MNSVPVIPLPTLWTVLMDGLAPIWPASRTQIDKVPLGDAWPCALLPSSPPAQPWETVVPFHKTAQWLAYSLMAPMARLLRIRFAGAELLTGLAEYRNGGLLVDTGLLTLKPGDMRRGLDAYDANAKIDGQPKVEVVPLFSADDGVVVEWRAATIGFLDELHVEVNRMLGLGERNGISLALMLEAGTWIVSFFFAFFLFCCTFFLFSLDASPNPALSRLAMYIYFPFLVAATDSRRDFFVVLQKLGRSGIGRGITAKHQGAAH